MSHQEQETCLDKSSLVALWSQEFPRLSEPEIARRLGSTLGVVKYQAREVLALPNRGKSKESNWAEERDALTKRLWLQDNPRLSEEQIAACVGTSRATLRRHARVTLGLPNRGFFYTIVWTPEKDALHSELRQQTDPFLSQREIAEKLGVSEQSAWSRANELGLPPRPEFFTWWGVDKREETLIRLWTIEKKSIRHCARILQTSPGAVSSKLARLGLDGKGGKEIKKPQRYRRPAAVSKFAVLAFSELRDNGCTWPVGDPLESGFDFCGRRRSSGHSYCAHHAAIAYGRAA